VQLLPYQVEFEARQTRVAIISFAPPALAHEWIDETRSSFPFIIDRSRKAYQAYGLESSLLRSWSPKVWLAYVRLIAQGMTWRGIQGNSAQLGGDFIIDQGGIIRMAHRSHDPTDRPTVKKIIQVLDEIKIYSIWEKIVPEQGTD